MTNLSSTAGQPGYDYSWDMIVNNSSAATSNDENAVINLPTPGVYDALLVISNPTTGCSAELDSSSVVRVTGNTIFTVSKINSDGNEVAYDGALCNDELIKLTNTSAHYSTCPECFSWDLGLGAVNVNEQGQTVTFSYASDPVGDVTWTLDYTDSTGECEDSHEETRSVDTDYIDVDFSVLPTVVCEDSGDVTMTNLSTTAGQPGYTYSWDMSINNSSAATSNDENAVINLLKSIKVYDALLVISNPTTGCSAELDSSSVVRVTGNTIFTVSKINSDGNEVAYDGALCNDELIKLTNTSAHYSTCPECFSWDLGLGAVNVNEQGQTVTFSYASDPVGDVTWTLDYTDSTGECEDSHEETRSVDTDYIDVDFSVLPTVICEDSGDVTMTNLSSTAGQPGYDYSWDMIVNNSSAATSNDENAVINLPTPGVYDALLVISNPTTGCSAELDSSSVVRVTGNTIFTVSKINSDGNEVAYDGALCNDELIKLTNTSAHYSTCPECFSWDLGLGAVNVNEQGQTVTFSYASDPVGDVTWTLDYTDSTGECEDSHEETRSVDTDYIDVDFSVLPTVVCEDSGDVTMTNLSTTAGQPGYTYSWDMSINNSSAATSNDENAVINLPTPGVYDALLVISNPTTGCSAELDSSSVVRVTGNTIFTVSKINSDGNEVAYDGALCNDELIKLTNTSTHYSTCPECFSWDLGLGAVNENVDGATITFSYASDPVGDVTWTLDYTDSTGECEDSHEETRSIDTDYIDVDFSVLPTVICEDSGDVTMTNLSSTAGQPGYDYSWDMIVNNSSAATSNDENAVINLPTPGVYDALLVISNPTTGCSAELDSSSVVRVTGNTIFTVSKINSDGNEVAYDGALCNDELIKLTNTSVHYSSCPECFDWDLGLSAVNVNEQGQTVTFSYASDPVGDVTWTLDYTDSTGECEDSHEETRSVDTDYIDVDFSVLPTVICEDSGDVTMTNLSSTAGQPGYDYSWDMIVNNSSAATSNDENAVINLPTPGVYDALLVISNPTTGCSAELDSSSVVRVTGNTIFTVSKINSDGNEVAYDGALCNDELIKLTNTSAHYSTCPECFSWDLGLGAVNENVDGATITFSYASDPVGDVTGH